MCRPDQERPASTPAPVTRATDLKYVIPEHNNGNSQVQIGAQRPQADGSSPTPSSGLSHGLAAESCRPSLVLTVLLSALAASSSRMSSAWLWWLCVSAAVPIVKARWSSPTLTKWLCEVSPRRYYMQYIQSVWGHFLMFRQLQSWRGASATRIRTQRLMLSIAYLFYYYRKRHVFNTSALSV